MDMLMPQVKVNKLTWKWPSTTHLINITNCLSLGTRCVTHYNGKSPVNVVNEVKVTDYHSASRSRVIGETLKWSANSWWRRVNLPKWRDISPTIMNLCVNSLLFNNNPLSGKSSYDAHTLEYRINWDNYLSPYENAGMLLQMNEKFTIV